MAMTTGRAPGPTDRRATARSHPRSCSPTPQLASAPHAHSSAPCRRARRGRPRAERDRQPHDRSPDRRPSARRARPGRQAAHGPSRLRRAHRGGGAPSSWPASTQSAPWPRPTRRSSPSCSRASRTPTWRELLEAVARANRIALDFGRGGLTDPDEVPEPPEGAGQQARRPLAAGRPSPALWRRHRRRATSSA